MPTSTLPYRLSIDGFAPDAFRVLSLTGKETISEAWWFDVVVLADAAGDPVERAALAQRATLIFDLGDKQRAFYGVVARVRLAEVHVADGSIRYVVRVVPRLWLLRRKTRSRIFQSMRVPDIVSSVLLEAGIATRWQLTRAYPEREYCTQYEETDYHFVRRLLAEAGIYFYFFGGGPVSDAALAADAAVGAASAVGSSVAGFLGAPDVGALAGSAAQMAETLIPGDTVVGADDAACYPPVGGDDPAALAASTAAAMAPAIGDALGAGDGIAGAVLGTASAVAGTVIADLTEGGHAAPVMQFMNDHISAVSRYDKVTRFTLRNSVRSSGAMFRTFDPDRPQVQLTSAAVSTQPFPPSPFELAAEAAAAVENAAGAAASALPGPAAGTLGAVGGAVATVDAAVNEVAGALGQKVPFEVYAHHDPFLFPKWAFGNDEAPRILRQKRRRASIADGEGGCSDFSPGHRFALARHLAQELDGAYVLTSVEHRGHTFPSEAEGRLVYANTFACAPAEMPYPPPRPKRKCIQVALTATVVGPDGEEIYVDEKGQIKVQFHWDREGTYDENSSCWIRTMQSWAGAAWGHQFIPRVGMEVVVVFEGGDPDKPMVMGSVYNATHPPPFKLPEDKTRSGIRTHSSPGGGGFNELHSPTITTTGQGGAMSVGDDGLTMKSKDKAKLTMGKEMQLQTDTASVKMGDEVTIKGQKIHMKSPDAAQDGPAKDPDPPTKVELKDQDGKPVPYQRFIVKQSDETEIGGKTDKDGKAEPDLTSGGKIIFPDLSMPGDQSGGGDPAPYVVKQGDYVQKLAFVHGFDADKVWNDPKNADIKQSRPDPNVLAPGDVIQIPTAKKEGQPISKGTTNSYTVNIPKAKVGLVFRDGDQPLANEPAEVSGLGDPDPSAPPLTTDGGGKLSLDVPVTVREVTVSFPQREGMAFHYYIGNVDPVSEPAGLTQRLVNLGYMPTYFDEDPDQQSDLVKKAIAAFQAENGLDATGEADDATRKALRDIHQV